MPKSKHYFPLTPAYIERIHDELLSVSWPGVAPGSHSDTRDHRLLESAANRPFQTAFGRYIHRGIVRRGAALFHSLIANHPFGDGNKRTAITALHHFLLANGLLLVAKQEFMVKLALNTASSGERGVSQDELLREITTALENWTVPVSELRGIPKFGKIYRLASKLRRHIRTHPLNKA